MIVHERHVNVHALFEHSPDYPILDPLSETGTVTKGIHDERVVAERFELTRLR